MENFKFNLVADIYKSENDSTRRIIRGYASNPVSDRQGESLVQKGLDISDFVKYGYFNYDHNNSIILGYPHSTCRVDDKGLWVEGELLKGIPEADKIWELALALKKSDAPRNLGFSVEGKVLKREGSRICSAKIYNVAITTNPVNPTCTWEAVVKSFNGQADLDVVKALSTGYETNPEHMEGGEVFTKESLETSLKNLSYAVDDEEKKKKLKDAIIDKSLTRNEAILYLQLVKGLSRQQCDKLLNKI